MNEKKRIIDNCKKAAAQTRKDIIDMTYALGNTGAHLGGSLSLVEILSVLYSYKVKYDKDDVSMEQRDRVILSKGHGALALYPALAQAGIIEREQLKEFKKNGSKLSGHPSLHGLAGIEFASGSLGQGLSLGVGVAMALKRKNNQTSKVYVILGDGECDEGSVWEAVASGAHFGLDNLIAIVDENEIQYDGYTEEILGMNPFSKKWESFGWDVLEVDGHNINQLVEAFDKKTCKPLVIIAHTVKGKGVSFMEHDKRFHNARITTEQYEQAIRELEVNI